MAGGYIYFIQAELNEFIKIGWTDGHPSFRYSSLATASPCPLVTLGVIRGERSLESDIHNLFGHLRSHGEWFRPGEDLLAFIQKKARPWPAKGAYEPKSPGEEVWRKRQQRWMNDMSGMALMFKRHGNWESPVYEYWG